MKTKLLILCVLLALGGCDFTAAIRDQEDAIWRTEYLQDRPDLPADTRASIEAQRVRLGMTKEEVRASWGRPCDTSRHVSANGIIETWEYGWWSYEIGMCMTQQIVTFYDGVVYSWTNL